MDERARRADGAVLGRDDLLRDLVGHALAAAEGAGSIVLLTGDAGMGKTTVVRALIGRVRDAIAVSAGACLADQSAPAFWPWLAHAEPPPGDRLPTPDEAVGASRFDLLARMREQIWAVSREQPRLHVIEDLQWADVGSVLLLAELGQGTAHVPLLVVGTLRSEEALPPHLEQALGEVRRTAAVHELDPLADADVATLVRNAGMEPDDELLALIRRRTGGNPLFVTELLRALPLRETVERRRQILIEQVPTRVADTVVERLGRLPSAVAAALVAAAAIGSEGTLSVLAAAHDIDAESMLDLLEQARAARLLTFAEPARWRFSHELVRDAVYSTATGARRAHVHARILATLLDDPSSSPPMVARHALAALPVVESPRAVELAAEAGRHSYAHLAYEPAVAWFERALALAPGQTMADDWRAEVMVACGEAHRHLGDIEAARALLLDAAELTDDPDLLARVALGYADPGADLGIAYRSAEGTTVQLVERALTAQPDRDTATVVALEARLAAELYFSDQPGRSRPLAHGAVARARRTGEPRSLVVAGAVFHNAFVVGQAIIDEQLAGSEQLARWARASGSAGALLTAHRARVMDLLSAGDLGGVEAEIVAFEQIATPLRVPAYLWWLSLWSAMRALLEGRHDVAEQRAHDALHLGQAPFASLAFTNFSFLLFFLRREQGRLAEMEQATREYVTAHADVPALRVAWALLLAELDRLDEARTSLAHFDNAALARLHDRNWPASWFQLARAAALVGDRRLAAILLGDDHRPHVPCVQVSLGTVCLGAGDLAAAWLHETLGDAEAAEAHYRSAIALNARIGARSWLAQARADLGRLLVSRAEVADRAEGEALLALARSAADEIGLGTLRREDFAASPADTVAGSGTFRRTGSVWELSFAGRTVQVPDARGLRDLAQLLARPGEAVSVLELAGGTVDAGFRGAAALDERARAEIRRQLRQLDEAEADAEAVGDGAAAALARERRRELAEAVARDFGLRGRARRVGDPVERVRKTVSTRIRRTIATIARVHPDLGRHLERSIDTGTWCSYRPAQPVAWQT